MKELEVKIRQLKSKFQKNLEKGGFISFFDWECPPRQLKKDKDGSTWFDFDLDLEKIVGGEKVDEFTELPKIVTRKGETKATLDLIEKEFGQKQFLKLIADTNWLYLYPESLKRTGEARIREISRQFKRLLQKKADGLYGKGRIKIINFTRLVNSWTEKNCENASIKNQVLDNGFVSDYEDAFNEVLENFEEVVPEEIKIQWETRLVSHVGLTEKQKQERRTLAKRVIASYAAEGIVFDLLDKSGVLPNPVWISLDEPSFAGETTEILRKRKGLPPLTKIFLDLEL